MKVYKTITIFIVTSIFLLIFGISTGMAIPIDAGSSGTYTYAWDLVDDGATPKFTNDSTHSANVVYSWENWPWGHPYYGPRAYLNVTGTEGSVEWHFQTDSGSTFDDDVTVTANAYFYQSYTNNFVKGEWSNDGINYNEFYYFYNPSSDPAGYHIDVALSDSGYTGSSDLFVRFTLHRESGNSIAVQLFRAMSGRDEFVVTGSVNPIPEPATMLFLGSGLIGLAGARRKFKK